MKTRLYKFTPWLIRMLIPSGFKGTYILYSKDKNVVEPIYVGRSDTDRNVDCLTIPIWV